MTVTATARTNPLVQWPAHRIAVWAFLVNEGFLFGSILAAGLFLRLGGTVPWPRPGDALALGPVVVATLILIASSATLNESLDALRRGNFLFCRKWLVWTLLAGSLFLAIQAYEWWDVIATARSLSPLAGVPLVSNPWGASTFMQVFFLATGIHGLHVALGLLLMVWLLAVKGPANEKRLESIALYWHFVDFVWIFILSTFYFF
ncbi:MAG: cytochrome c oxidase subunit 3 [Vicinamibacteria bacterium]|nr:cytochrome c oxidase subunit 3 [Vicinamibacteria bacterium]